MKRLFTLIILFVSPLWVSAQLNLSGPPIPASEYYGNYNLMTTAISTPNTPDPGTNMYQRTVSYAGPGLYFNRWTIYRHNNYWHIAVYVYTPTSISQYDYWKYIDYSNSIDPPCAGIWEVLTGSAMGNQYTFTITGINCFDPASCNQFFAAYNDYVQMPTITSSHLDNILNPTKGMLTYDCETQRLMLHDGLDWRMVQGSQNDIILTESASILFGSNASISSQTDQINVNNDLEVNGNSNVTGSLTANNLTVNNTAIINGEFTSEAAVRYKTLTTTSNLTLNASHYMVFYIGNSNVTYTLPDPTVCPGRQYSLQNYGQNSGGKIYFSNYNVYVNGYSAPVAEMPAGESVNIISDGSAWRKVY